MRRIKALGAALVAALAVYGCAHRSDAVEPPITVKEVKVQVPVPCPALAALGPEPLYPDTAQAMEGATVAQAAALYAQGRLMRAQRLAEYIAVRTACVF